MSAGVSTINQESAIVGIIANPASGKDIRRLVAHASTFDNNEKINIVRRTLLSMDSIGVREVWHMPDSYLIVERAAEHTDLKLRLRPLPMEIIANASDSYEAARRLVDLGTGCIITLGGDGTNRIVAKGCGEVPLVAISTGTNNVFPRMIEGTLAGLAAGLVAQSIGGDAVTIHPKLEIAIGGENRDIALIDVVTSPQQWIGARAVWEPKHIREIVLSRISAGEIGMSSIGGALFPDLIDSGAGAWISVGGNGLRINAPIAPGIMREIPIADSKRLKSGETIRLQPLVGTIALDGEREIELYSDQVDIEVTLNPNGPRVVDITRAINLGARAGFFTRH